MVETIYSDLIEADPVLIKAYIDGVTGSTLNQVTMRAYGQKILVTVNKDNP